MPSQVNLPGMQALIDGTLPWVAGSDPRAVLVMTNSTCGSQNNVANTGAYTTLDRFDGSGYLDIALTAEQVNILASQGQIGMDAADIDFGVLGNGTRPALGFLVHFFNTNDAGSLPIIFVQFNVPVDPELLDMEIELNASGLVLVG